MALFLELVLKSFLGLSCGDGFKVDLCLLVNVIFPLSMELCLLYVLENSQPCVDYCLACLPSIPLEGTLLYN